MSYDLFFYARSPVQREAVLHYFQEAGPAYRISQEPDGTAQVLYVNDLTGVYFQFTCAQPASEPIADGEGMPPELAGRYDAGITLRLNLGRPTFFVLEAMPQVEALARHFDLVAIDPQAESPVETCLASTLVANWQKTNTWASRALGPLPKLPRNRSIAMWEYMRHMPVLQAKYPDLFVPDLFVFHSPEDGKPFTMITWWEATPQLFPPCDVIICGRQHSRYFGLKRWVEDGVMEYPDLLTLCGRYLEDVPGPVPDLKMLPPRHVRAVQSILDRVTFKRNWRPDDLQRLPMDGFVDEEYPA